ncbi:ABC transporter ATP-binding protein [Aestuariimicrobium sp. T2.26MG-19.2B]|uniref:ABC transporter ATP-binding protein n=1 Tax=Aestuariimicrobium sp. T2.26MG-19.2B TaxID=3040679 RepID=UPI00247787AC|nr:ABC transporter ATP-binding protein [Aestuariimicrobium sp. T2.26MG-19.2B]CAI9406329.1 Vitamin B12 import ATP-binding protein BtuD [Aestuariimicrobium sp. T2.26MG-19.2B]
MVESAEEPQVSVVITDVSVTYDSEIEPPPDGNALHRLAHSVVSRVSRTKVHALREVSLTVREGEHVGIVGSNGSGKSTLLRVIAGVQPPDAGQVLATATPMLLGVNAALLPHMSGRKNVRLGLLALGFSPVEVAQITPRVLDLAGIGDAINRPMSTYSSGMGARLRFAIAAASNPEILLIDEALGTGDASFAERSARTIKRLREQAGTIFLVSHAAQTIERLCTRAVWLHEGELVTDGDAVIVARTYRQWAWQVAQENFAEADKVMRDTLAGDLWAEREREQLAAKPREEPEGWVVDEEI